MKKMENLKWKEHPWSKTGMVEEIDIHFLKRIANPNNEPFTDDLNGVIKAQSIIFDQIEKEGMRDPLLIVISNEHKTIRLEAGNHRINEAISRGYTHLPVATLVIRDKMLYSENGVQVVCAKDLIDFDKVLKLPYPYQIKLSELINKDIFG